MKIVIDNREKKFHKTLLTFFDDEEQKKINCSVEVKQLDLGDIIIYDDEERELLMFERKTPADLASSIMDGRYNEQSFRLSNYKLHNHNIVYLIEGSIEYYNDRFSRIKKDALRSALFSVNYYKGFSVMQTSNMIESVNLILRVVKKICREKNKPGYYNNYTASLTDVSNNTQEATVLEEDYACVIKKEKKLNITPNNIGIIMLSQIPGVSTQAARVIMSNFENFEDFMNNFNKPDFILKNAKYTLKNGSQRTISKTSLANIKKYLF